MLPDSRQQAAPASSEIALRSPGSFGACRQADWDALNTSGSPFLSQAFHAELERQGLVNHASGWRSAPLLAVRGTEPVAALPVYEKNHSFGEFVFDWAWAEAYEQLGRAYFPKLIVAVPFTPVPGPRILARDSQARAAAVPQFIAHLRKQLEERHLSSLHFLFTSDEDCDTLEALGLLPRLDCRFFWHNAGYEDFESFLSDFSARQRKNIRRERRIVRTSGVRFSWHTGTALGDLDWDAVHALCANTFHRHGHRPYLNAAFFRAFAEHHPDQLLVNLGKVSSRLVAAVIFFRDRNTLYGRYWGSSDRIDCLHFEACYYQGIEYAIRKKIEFFDPGTQGEHKLRRGFAPIASRSAHWFRHPDLHGAINHWLGRERQLVRQYISDCETQMPFRVQVENS